MHYLLHTPRDRGFRLWAGSRVLAPAAIATLPMWMRRMGRFDQPAAVDAAVASVARAWVQALSARNFRPMVAVAHRIACARRLDQVLSAFCRGKPPPCGNNGKTTSSSASASPAVRLIVAAHTLPSGDTCIAHA